MRAATRHFLWQAGMIAHQMRQLTPQEIDLVEVARIAGLEPNEISYRSAHGLVVSASGVRKLAALSAQEGLAQPEAIKALLRDVGYQEAVSRQQRRPTLFKLTGPPNR